MSNTDDPNPLIFFLVAILFLFERHICETKSESFSLPGIKNNHEDLTYVVKKIERYGPKHSFPIWVTEL